MKGKSEGKTKELEDMRMVLQQTDFERQLWKILGQTEPDKEADDEHDDKYEEDKEDNVDNAGGNKDENSADDKHKYHRSECSLLRGSGKQEHLHITTKTQPQVLHEPGLNQSQFDTKSM